MIRETLCHINYPSKTILEDVLERDGDATEESYSPFPGMRSEFERQFKKYDGSITPHNLCDYVFGTMSSGYTDFDLNKAVDWVENNGVIIRRGWLICDTLEDLMSKAHDPRLVIKKYIEYMCVGFKKNKASILVSNNVEFTRLIFDKEHEENVEEKDELLDDTDKDDTEQLEEVIEKLPYLIKTIWEYSKIYQANLFSFIYAYLDIIGNGELIPVSSVTPFRYYTLYRLTRKGEFHSQFVHEKDNKYSIYRDVLQIFTCPSKHREIWKFIIPFINSIRLLGVDYRKEDPMMFSNDLISRLVCTYLPDTDTYIRTYGNLDAEVILALKPENIFSTAKYDLYEMFDSKGDTASNVRLNYETIAWHVLDVIDTIVVDPSTRADEVEMFTADNTDTVISIGQIVCNVLGIQNPSFEFDQDILYCNKSVFTVPGYLLGSFKNNADYSVILFKCGIAVIATSNYSEIYYLDFNTICSIVSSKYFGGNNGSNYVDWHYLGV